MKTLSPDDLDTIRHHVRNAVPAKTLAGWFGVSVWAMRGAIAVIETAPSGAPGAGSRRPRNAGTAAATLRATGQPSDGPDDAPPLRKPGGAVAAPPANSRGQSGRPVSPPVPAGTNTIPAEAPPRPERVPSERPPAARDLAALVEEALRSGRIRAERCPAAVAAPTQGVTIDPADAAAMRRRHDAERDVDRCWRGRRRAVS